MCVFISCFIRQLSRKTKTKNSGLLFAFDSSSYQMRSLLPIRQHMDRNSDLSSYSSYTTQSSLPPPTGCLCVLIEQDILPTTPVATAAGRQFAGAGTAPAIDHVPRPGHDDAVARAEEEEGSRRCYSARKGRGGRGAYRDDVVRAAAYGARTSTRGSARTGPGAGAIERRTCPGGGGDVRPGGGRVRCCRCRCLRNRGNSDCSGPESRRSRSGDSLLGTSLASASSKRRSTCVERNSPTTGRCCRSPSRWST